VIDVIFVCLTEVDAKGIVSNGRTALAEAAGMGHVPVVKFFLGRDDVDVNAGDNFGDTPLSFAVECGHEEVVKLLLKRKDVE